MLPFPFLRRDAAPAPAAAHARPPRSGFSVPRKPPKSASPCTPASLMAATAVLARRPVAATADLARSDSRLSLCSSVSSANTASTGAATVLRNSTEDGRRPEDVLFSCDEPRLLRLFEDMLDSMGFDETRRTALRAMPKDSKWKMLHQHLAASAAPAAGAGTVTEQLLGVVSSDKASPAYHVKALSPRSGGHYHNNAVLTKTLVSLRVSLTTQPIAWLTAFIDSNGVAVLFALLEHLNAKPKRRDTDFCVEYDLCRTLKALMNNQMGLQAVLDAKPRSITLLTLSLNSPHFFVRKICMDLLTTIAYVEPPFGHQLVYHAFLNLEKKPFKSWIASLNALLAVHGQDCGGGGKDGIVAGVGWVGENRVLERDIIDYIVSHMILSNALVGLPSDVDMRIHIRNQLVAAGFQDAIQQLHFLARGNEYLRRQLETFETDMNDDWNEYRVRFSLSVQELNDPVAIAQRLSEQCVKTDAYAYFVSLMQHLLAVRPNAQVMYFKFIDQLVTSVVLDRKGIDPDFEKGLDAVDIRSNLEQLLMDGGNGGTFESSDEELVKQLEDMVAEKEALEMEIAEREEMNQTQWRLKEAEYQDIIETLRGGSIGYESSMQHDETRLNEILQHLAQQNINVNNPSQEDITDDVVEKLDKKLLVAELLRLRDQNVVIKTEAVLSRNASYATLHPIPESRNDMSETIFSCPPPPPPPNPLFSGSSQDSIDSESTLLNGPPPPPLPPPMAPGLVTKKPRKEPLYQPNKKLKPFQWEKLPDAVIDETIWQECDERELVKVIGEDKMLAAWKTMEDLFAVEPSPIESKSSLASDETCVENEVKTKEEEKEKVKEVSVIEPKRAYNLNILLSRIKMDIRKLVASVYKMDVNTIHQQLASLLLSYIPTDNEKTMLLPYKERNDVCLARADTFLLEASLIDRYEDRLFALAMHSSLEERLLETRQEVASVMEASAAVSNSTSLRDILKLALLFGNAMNGKSFRGGAYGFRISGLNSMMDAKSVDGKTSLLDFIVAFAESNLPTVFDIVGDLKSVEQATRVSLQALRQEMQAIETSVKKLQVALSSFKTSSEPDDAYLGMVKPTVSRIVPAFEVLQSEFDKMMEQHHRVMKSFGEDDKEMTSEAFFGIFKSFIASFEHAIDRQKRMREEEERKQRMMQEKAKQRAIASAKQQDDEQQKGVMDDLLENLKKGGVPRLLRDNSMDSLNKLGNAEECGKKAMTKRIESCELSYGDLEQQAVALFDRIGEL